jgi:small GTP-binding protein
VPLFHTTIAPLEGVVGAQPGIIKIANHSQSSFMSETTSGTGVLLMRDFASPFFVYNAPETLGHSIPDTSTTLFTPKSDVYSIGTIASEMWSRRFPWSSVMSDNANITNNTAYASVDAYGNPAGLHPAVQRLQDQIREGDARESVADDCPAGLHTLILECWMADPEERISSKDALSLSRTPNLMAPFECTDWCGVVEAIESNFWSLTSLRERISIAIAHLGTGLAFDATSMNDGQIELLLDMTPSPNMTSTHDLRTFLQAIHFFLVNASIEQYEGAFSTGAVAYANCELIAGMLQLEDASPIATELNLLVVEIAHLIIGFAPECPFWDSFVKDCVGLAELHSRQTSPLLHACLAFFAANVIYPNLREIMLKEGTAEVAMRVATRCQTDVPLQSVCAALLLEASAEAWHRVCIMANLPAILSVIERHQEQEVLITRWTSVLQNVTSNPLGSAEVIRAGGLPVVMAIIGRHAANIPFLRAAMTVLQNIAAEPLHVEDLADAGVPMVAVNILATFQTEAELATACCSILAAIFATPSLKFTLRDTPLVRTVIETMRLHPQNERVLGSAMQLVAKLTDGQDGSYYIRQALDDASQGVFVKSVWNFRQHVDLVRPGLTVFGLLAVEFSERTRMVEQDVPRLIVDSMRHFNEDASVQVEALKTLCVLANDKQCRTAIRNAGGIATTLVAITKHRPQDFMMQLALELLLQLVMDPTTRKSVREAKIVAVLADILRVESGRARLITLSVSMLAVLAHHENITDEFTAEKLKPTLEGLMLAFKGNTALQHDGAAAIQKTMPPVESTLAGKGSINPFKIVIVGKLNVGKTSLLRRACQNTFSPHTQSTIGVHIDYAKIEFPSHNVTLQVYDTAGEERFRSLTKSFYRGAHGAILVYDITREDSLEELDGFAYDIKQAVPHDVQMLILGTKTDLKEKEHVDAKLAKKFAKFVGGQHFAVSALQNVGVHKAFRDLTERLLRRWPAGPPTDPNVVSVEKVVEEKSGCC